MEEKDVNASCEDRFHNAADWLKASFCIGKAVQLLLTSFVVISCFLPVMKHRSPGHVTLS